MEKTKLFTLLLLFIAMMNYPLKGEDMVKSSEPNIEVATFGGGCFWCLEPVFESMKGVVSVQSGYSGGHVKNPSYKQVSAGNTGHAEVVQIQYNQDLVSFTELLEVFFSIHDPTTLNRQGADVGTQYRSAIFYHSASQKETAEAMIAELKKQKVFKNPIVTEVTAFDAFYAAEDYHQEYYAKNPNQGYCRLVIAPKVDKFKKAFKDQLKEE